MRKGITTCLLILLIVSLALTGCGSGDTQAPQSEDKTIKWDYMMLVGSMEHPEGKFAVEFADEVEKRTNGKLKITVRPGGELPYKSDEYIRVTGEGKVQISGALVSAVTGDLKAGALTGLPFLFTEMEQINDIMKILTPYLNEELDRFGCQLLYYYPWPPQVLWGKGEVIDSVEGIQGMKFRSQGVEQAAFLKEHKAIPVSIGSPEVPPALQRGIVDGVITAAANNLSAKWYELLDWGYMLNIQTIPSYVVVNKKALESLPEDVRKTLLEVAEEFNMSQPAKWEQLDKEARVEIAKKGIIIKEPSQEEIDKLTENAKVYWEQWVQEKGGKAPEALKKIREALGK